MAVCHDKGLYAIGSQSHVTLLDSRAPKHVGCINSKQRGCGEYKHRVLAHPDNVEVYCYIVISSLLDHSK